MILMNVPNGIFVWSEDVIETSLIFRTKFQNLLSEYLMTIEDCKKFRNVLSTTYTELKNIINIVNLNIKVKDPSFIFNASDSLFQRWKLVTFQQLDEYEKRFKSLV